MNTTSKITAIKKITLNIKILGKMRQKIRSVYHYLAGIDYLNGKEIIPR
jgi:hypothetical protein